MMRTLAMCMTAAALLSLEGCARQTNQQWSSKGDPSRLGAVESAEEIESVAPTAESAMAILEEAATSEYAVLRANAIEAFHGRPDAAEDIARRGLADPNRGVRFVAVMTIGKLQLKDSAYLVEPLLLDESPSVQAAALYALQRCGREVDLTPLAAMLRSADLETRGNAAFILGELGQPSAAPMLEQAAGVAAELANPSQLKIVELQIAEALVRLGRTDMIHPIRAALFLPAEEQEVTALACLICGRVGDEKSVGSLQRLIEASGQERRPAEVRMAAANSLARLGYPVPGEVVSEYVTHDRPELRAQAALTLGVIGGPEAARSLGRLINDPSPLVRVAAAGAILQAGRW